MSELEINKCKIAIYCCGYLRGFRTSLIKMKELLIDQKEKYDCDLYFYIISNEFETDKYINTKYNIDTIIQECNPKYYIVEKNQYDQNPLERIKQMWFKIYICNTIRHEIEYRENFKYDRIIRIRPDLKLNCNQMEIDTYIQECKDDNCIVLPDSSVCSYPDLQLDDKKGLNCVNDQFAIGTSKAMDIYCSMYNHLYTLNQLGIKNSSSCLYTHLYNNKLQIKQVKINSSLILRENRVITIAGDSGTGKTTFASKFKNYMEEKLGTQVLLFECDRYHKWPRGDKHWKQYTHLNPEANLLDQMKQDIISLKSNHSIEQVDYDHHTGKFTDAQSIEPSSIVIVLGLHTLIDSTLNLISDCKIYIEPEYNLKCDWKIDRDKRERGYTKEQSLYSMECRKEDYDLYIKPQKENADIWIKYISTPFQVYLYIKQSFMMNKLKCHDAICYGNYCLVIKNNLEECLPLIEELIC